MAEGEIYSKRSKRTSEKTQENASKFHSHILYKVLTAIFFIVILPLVPSQAPEFINQALLTRSWELLHLLFVGIAVSYGLFSRRNEDKEDEINTSSKFDNAQSYVSGLLQVSSVFDYEAESPTTGSDETVPSSDESNKVQTWRNRYFRNEPVVVAEERPNLNEQRVRSEKPLLLPVRSLKSRLADVDFADESEIVSASKSSRSSSKRLLSQSMRSTAGEFGGLSLEEAEDNKLNENTVLRSPVPWRSKSGRMEMKEEADNPHSPKRTSAAAPMENSEPNWMDSKPSKSQISRSSRSITESAQKHYSPSPLPTVSPESQAKSAEDLMRKKSFYRSPPPPPPPPPPPGVRRIFSMKPNSWINDNDAPHKKDLRLSFTSKPRDSNRNIGDDIMTIGANSKADIMARNHVDKSVRTVRGGEVETELALRREREIWENELKGKMEQKAKDFEVNPNEFRDFADKEIDMESEDEEEEEDFVREENEEKFRVNQNEERKSCSDNEDEGSSSMGNDGGPDVDKKADEFIAKFREQIRLQRIESIKRSSGQIRRNS